MDIPKTKHKPDLYKKLIINILGGFWNILGVESRRYFHLMCILIDKSIYEYTHFYSYLEKEIENNDPLSYKLEIIWHLENCINAVSRASKIMRIVVTGLKGNKKKQVITNLIDKRLTKNINKVKILKIRNRIEHIEEDIFNNKVRGSMLVNLTDANKNIAVNGKELSLEDLVLLIDDFYELLIDINNKLPNKV